MKNSLIDVCEQIESGSTLSEAMGKAPKAFNRLYVNMIKAGEAGRALDVILKRLAEFQERDQALRRKVKAPWFTRRGRHLCRRHPVLHHVEGRAAVHQDLRRLQARPAADDGGAD